MATITFDKKQGFWTFRLDDGRKGTGNTFSSCIEQIARLGK